MFTAQEWDAEVSPRHLLRVRAETPESLSLTNAEVACAAMATLIKKNTFKKSDRQLSLLTQREAEGQEPTAIALLTYFLTM